MKRNRPVLTTLLSLLCLPAGLHAASGVWTNPAGGSWINTANWSGGTIATGVDSTADFSTLDLTAAATVTLDGDQTIGTLITDDTGSTGGTTNWIFKAGTGGTLTFATSSGTPVLNAKSTVAGNGQNPVTTVLAAVAGTSGLDKQGPGMVTLGNANNLLSGSVLVSGGVLGVSSNSVSLPNITDVTVASGAQFVLGDWTGSGYTDIFGKPIALTGSGVGNYGALFIRGNSVTGRLTNTVTLNGSSTLGIYGVTAAARIEGGVVGTGNLTLRAQAGAVTHTGRIEVRSPMTYSGDTVLVNLSISNIVAIYGNDYLPTSTLLRLEPGNATGASHFSLNGFNQTVGGLSSTATASSRRIINGSATPATFTVNDSVGGHNFSGVLGGPNANDNNFSVVKQGVGQVSWSGANTFTGGLWVQAGMVTMGAANTFTGGIQIDPGATYTIFGGGNPGNNNITNNGELRLNYTVPRTLANIISGTGSVTNVGSGVATLSATNIYTGWTVCNGYLVGQLNLFSSRFLGGGGIFIDDGNTNDLSVDVAGASLSCSSLIFGTSAGAILQVDTGALGNPTAPVFNVAGPVTLNGATKLILTGASLTPGRFTLIKYNSLIGGVAGFNPAVTITPPLAATLVDTGSSIDVVVSSGIEEVWNGNLSADWDTSTMNWTNRSAGTATTYSGTNSVRFDDGAAGTTAVNLTLPVTPPLVTVSNATRNYSFTSTGGGWLSGSGGLTKQGAATLTLATPNDYAGNTTIQAGSLVLGASEVIPDGTGKGNLSLNGVLDLAGFTETVNNLSGNGSVTNSSSSPSAFTVNATTAGTYAGTISGNVGLTKLGAGLYTLSGSNVYTGGTLVAGGNLMLSNTAGQCVQGNIVLTNTARLLLGAANQLMGSAVIIFADGGTNNARFEPSGFNDTIAGIQDNATNGNRIVEAASDGVSNEPSTLTLNVASGQTYTHASFIRNAAGTATNSVLSLTKTGAGTQVFSAAAPLVSYSGLTLVSDGILEFSGLNSVANNSVVTLNGGFVKFSGGGLRTNTLAGGAGGLIVSGTNVLTLAGVNTYTGATIVSNNGTLLVSGAIATGPVAVNAGGTLGGNGTISGPVAINAGGTLAPGTNAIGLLSISNTLSLDAASQTLITLNKSSATYDGVVGVTTLSYGGALTVTNLAGTFAGGETYQLFGANSYVGNFSATNLPPLPGGLSWNWNPATGTLAVSSGVASYPTNISYSVSGGTLTLNWPASHLGWYAQSNSVNLASTNYWFDIAGSQSTTNLMISINPAQPEVFFRLRKP